LGFLTWWITILLHSGKLHILRTLQGAAIIKKNCTYDYIIPHIKVFTTLFFHKSYYW
jgi:hypothetical protein